MQPPLPTASSWTSASEPGRARPVWGSQGFFFSLEPGIHGSLVSIIAFGLPSLMSVFWWGEISRRDIGVLNKMMS